MVVYSTRRRGGRGLAYILYVRIHEQVHLTQCRDFSVSRACATSKLWNWLFKHHTPPLSTTCMQAVVILGHSRVMLPSVGPRGRHRCMHHFDLHRERLINFTINEDSFGLYILRQEHIVCVEEGGRGPSYVVRFMNFALCGCMVYGFWGMWHIKVVYFRYSTYVWPILTLPHNERG